MSREAGRRRSVKVRSERYNSIGTAEKLGAVGFLWLIRFFCLCWHFFLFFERAQDSQGGTKSSQTSLTHSSIHPPNRNYLHRQVTPFHPPKQLHQQLLQREKNKNPTRQKQSITTLDFNQQHTKLRGMAPKKKNQKTSLAAMQAKANVQPITDLTEKRVAQSKKPYENDDLKPKEQSEIELENLIFGDNEDLIGEALSRVGHEMSSDEEGDELDEFDYEGDEDRQDEEEGSADMFFMDTGPVETGTVGKASRKQINEDDDDEEEGFHRAGVSSDEESEDMKLTGIFQSSTHMEFSSWKIDRNSKELNANIQSFYIEIEIYGGRPAWVDEDDKTLVVSLKSANRLKKLRKAEEEDTVTGVDYEQRLRRQYV